MVRMLAAIILVTVVSCGATAPVVFSGRDIEYERGFAIKARKDRDRILVVCGGHHFGISLPYSEDWIFESTPAKPMFGRSRSRELVVTVQVADRPGPAEEEPYLQEVLRSIRSKMEPSVISVLDPRFVKLGDHVVLGYKTELSLEGKATRQFHFWGMRRSPDGTTYEIHFSTTAQSDPQLQDLITDVCSIITQEFQIIPQRK